MAIASSLADVSARLSGFMLAFRLPDWLLHELQDKLVLHHIRIFGPTVKQGQQLLVYRHQLTLLLLQTLKGVKLLRVV